MQQSDDFLAESRVLATLLSDLSDDDFARATQFRRWTVNDVLAHLHFFNYAAELSLIDDSKILEFLAPVSAILNTGQTLLQAHQEWIAGLQGRALLNAWLDGCNRLAERFAGVEPSRRLKWAGPDMSARSSVTARQMETWAHGQALFDRLGVVREEDDRIKNIAHLCVSTYGWSFNVRRLDVPDPAPFVRLTAPSGKVWTWHEEQTENVVYGSALALCQVAAQVRNMGDTDLQTSGDIAARWMSIAQCFAGPAVDGPAPGARYLQTP